MNSITTPYPLPPKPAPYPTGVLKLDGWRVVHLLDKVVLNGVITNQGHLEKGTRVNTPALQGFTTDAQGKYYAITVSALYELGQRFPQWHPSS